MRDAKQSYVCHEIRRAMRGEELYFVAPVFAANSPLWGGVLDSIVNFSSWFEKCGYNGATVNQLIHLFLGLIAHAILLFL